MQKLKCWRVTVLLLMLPLLSNAQTDSIARAKAARKKGNTTKLEIQYQSVTYTKYSSNGYSRSYQVNHPMISINGKRAVAIDKRGDILRRYYARCYQAQAELDKSNTHRRLAKLYMWSGFAAGTVVAFSGLFNNPDMDEGRFFSRFGMGAGVMLTGTIMAFINKKKSARHLHLSVDVYNDQCYFPLTTDTTKKPESTASRKPGTPSPMKMVPEKKVRYEILRSEPENSGMSGFALTLVNVDVSGLSVNIKGGAGAFYTYKSLFGISVDYQVAYLDNPTVEKNTSPYGSWNETAGPAQYRRANNLDIQTKFAAKSWMVERSYGVRLGSKRLGEGVAEVVSAVTGDVQKSLTLRLGYQIDNRLIYGSSSGIDFQTNTAPYIYHYNGQEFPLSAGSLGDKSTMMHSGIVSAGIGLSSFWDMKIRLRDDEFTGIREVKIQRDLYVDALYAQQLKLEDMVYNHALEYVTQEGHHIPQRINLDASPVTRIGMRAGIRATRMKSSRGARAGAEIGIRPGPKFFMDNIYFQLQLALIFGGRIAQ